MEASLPPTSPGQKNLFWLYNNIYKDDLDDVPALLPEIWVHWDPKTVRARGAHALQNLRMDFLMLLPGNWRVVLEVDGLQHFTRNSGTEPDSAKYAATMAGDRDLKLRGYEVFRFGHGTPRPRPRPAPARRLLLHAPGPPIRRSASSAAISPRLIWAPLFWSRRRRQSTKASPGDRAGHAQLGQELHALSPGHLVRLLVVLAAVLGALIATLALAAAFAPTATTRPAARTTLDLLLRLVPWYTPRS